MLSTNEYKKDYLTVSSYVVGALYATAWLAGGIWLQVTSTNPVWYLPCIFGVGYFILLIPHINVTKKLIKDESFSINIRRLYTLMFIHLFCLNFPLFAFELVGSFYYKKRNSEF